MKGMPLKLLGAPVSSGIENGLTWRGFIASVLLKVGGSLLNKLVEDWGVLGGLLLATLFFVFRLSHLGGGGGAPESGLGLGTGCSGLPPLCCFVKLLFLVGLGGAGRRGFGRVGITPPVPLLTISMGLCWVGELDVII